MPSNFSCQVGVDEFNNTYIYSQKSIRWKNVYFHVVLLCKSKKEKIEKKEVEFTISQVASSPSLCVKFLRFALSSNVLDSCDNSKSCWNQPTEFQTSSWAFLLEGLHGQLRLHSGTESPYDFQHGGQRRRPAEYFITWQTLEFRLCYTISEINMVSIMQPNLILEKLYEDENQVPVTWQNTACPSLRRCPPFWILRRHWWRGCCMDHF